jgi:taurine dioxygenase
MFDITPVTGHLGAEISGIDLADDLSDEVIGKLDAALVAHKVLFFRDQHELTDERQRDFAARFGEIAPHPFLPHVEGIPEVSILSTPAFGKQSWPTLQGNWHSDVTFSPTPPMGTMLRAVSVPPQGRDTLWCDMEAVYEFLSATMKEMLAPLCAEHDFRRTFNADNARLLSSTKSEHEGDMLASIQQATASMEPSVHPLVRTHPVSGRKAVYVNSSFTERIVGLRPDESKMLLDFLLAQTRFHEFQVRFRWTPGSLAFWDNRSTQHYIVSDYDFARVMHRTTIKGDAPR